MAISSALGSSALLPAGLGFRNKIINGDMRIVQRGTATITGSGSAQYPVDRWAVFNGTGTVTFVQSTDAPAGFNASILATVTATGSYSTSGYTQITHKIEGFNCQDLAYGTASAKPIVLSFWVKSSVVGTQNVSFKNGGNNRVYVATYTVDVAGVWEKKTVSIVGDTTGTWLVDSGIGLEVTFNLGMGTTYDVTAGSWQAAAAKYSTSGAIDFAANSGATFYFTGVQLEQNLQPTPFEQRPIGTELALCQRYYQVLENSSVYTYFCMGEADISTNFEGILHLPVPMRANISSMITSGTASHYQVYGAAIGSACTAVPTGSGNKQTVHISASTTGLTAGRAYLLVTNNTTSGYLAFSTEF